MNIQLTERQSRELGLLSDDQILREHRLQALLARAIANLRSVAQDVNAGSALVRVDLEALDDALHDYAPDQAFWAHLLAEKS